MRTVRTCKLRLSVIALIALHCGAGMTLTVSARATTQTPSAAPQQLPQTVTANALFSAVETGNVGALSGLLQRGGDPNARENPANTDYRGFTLLHRAADLGNVSIVEALLAAKADPNQRDKSGFAPLHYAVHEGVGVTVTLTPGPQGGAGQTRLQPGSAIARTARERIVQLLIQKGADPNARSNSGTTPLMEAGGSAGLVLTLVKNGADINAVNNDGESALHAALFMYTFAAKGMEMAGGDASGTLKGIEALVESGADVNLLSQRGKTPLDNAMPVVVPGLIEPPPGGVENLPSVKYLRSKGGRTAEELKKTTSSTSAPPAGRLSGSAEKSGSSAKNIGTDVVRRQVPPAAASPGERRRRVAFRLPSGEDAVFNINVTRAQQLTNLNSITTNAAERALIEETLLGPRRRSTFTLTDTSETVRFSGHIAASAPKEVWMIALEQDQSPLFTRIYTNRPSEDEKAEFQLHPLELQIRRGAPISTGSHVVADVLKYLKDRLTSSRAATVTGAVLWKAASELPRTQSVAKMFLSRAYVAGVKDTGNAGVPVLQRTQISDYLNKLGPDEWLIYLDCGPNSSGVHVWRPVRLQYRSEKSEPEIAKMFIMKDDGSVVSLE